MKTQKTHMEVKIFEVVASNYLKQQEYYDAEGKDLRKPNTKLSSALKTMLRKQMPKIAEVFNDESDAIKEQFAATHPTYKTLLLEDKASPKDPIYQYTPENRKKMRKALRELMDTKVDIEQRVLPKEDIPTDLTDEEIDVFSGFVLEEIKEEETK